MRPLCRYCGRPIAKRTTAVYFGMGDTRADEYSQNRTERPATKAEAQRLLNLEIAAVRRSADGGYVRQVTVWDGESYASRYFCTGEHAKRFAAVMAKAGHCTKAYNDALKEEQR